MRLWQRKIKSCEVWYLGVEFKENVGEQPMIHSVNL